MEKEKRIRPRIMGILNMTPDSFYRESRQTGVSQALAAARSMIQAGADLLDVGGESSRPGAEEVGADQEIQRVVPLIQRIREISSIPLSIDTRKAAVARAALDAGAGIINDISALRHDPDMGKLAAERKVPLILMHMKGVPKTMQKNPAYLDVTAEVREELLRGVDRALSAGLKEEALILDPGIGFGKRQEDNIQLLRSLPRLRDLGFPLLIGLSRKSFLGSILDKKPKECLSGSLAAHAWCLSQGVDYLRVHDVPETADLLAVWEALAWAD